MTRTSTNAYHDENDVPTLIAVSSVDNQTPVPLWADPTTHRLLVDSTGGGAALTVTDGSTTVNNVSEIDFTSGATVTNAGGGIVDISISGGGGFTQLTATGTVNGVNSSFTFTQQPTFIISDGAWYPPTDSLGNTNWTWNGGTLTATMTVPPTTYISGALLGNSPTAIFSDTVSGTINSSNKMFTVLNTITTAMVLYLAGIPYQPSVDFTVTGAKQITMTVAPDSSLSGQPFWLSHT